MLSKITLPNLDDAHKLIESVNALRLHRSVKKFQYGQTHTKTKADLEVIRDQFY